MNKFMFFMLCFWATTTMVAQSTFTQNIIDDDISTSGNFAIDLDGDGDVDIVAAESSKDDIVWYENDGSQNFTKHTIAGSFDGASVVYAIDFDQDGDIDVLGGAETNDRDVKWWENDGAQNFTEHMISDVDVKVMSIQPIDFDEDGDLDVVTAGRDNPNVVWWENDNMTFSRNIVKNNLSYTIDAFAADLNGDNNIDVVASSYTSSKIIWMENDDALDDLNFTEHNLVTNLTEPGEVVVADIDGDNDMDVVSTSSKSGSQVVWWENDGNGSFSSQTVGGLAYAYHVAVGDMNNDGNMDIIACADDGKMKWWENDGNQNFAEETIFSGYKAWSNLHIMDVDGDGDNDIVTGAYDDDELIWYENNLSNQALHFDGTDDYVSIGDINALDGTSHLTISGWFYFENLVDGTRLVTKEATAPLGWILALGGGSTGGSDDIRFTTKKNSVNKGSVYTDGLGLTTGKWYHIAVVYDGTQSTSDRVKIYVNGRIQTSHFHGSSFGSSLASNNNDVVLGAKSDGSSKFFKGYMDEISLWKTSLSQEELRDIMHTRITSREDLKAYYTFTGEDGMSTFTDGSTNNNDATWHGTSNGSNTTSNLEMPNYPYTNDNFKNIRGVWNTIGTSNINRSDGFRVLVSSALAADTHVTWGHDDAGSSVVSSNLSGTSASSRFLQTWKVESNSTVNNTDFQFDLGTTSGNSISAGVASNYVLLYRSGTSGNFTNIATGNEVTNTDRVKFNGIDVQEGYYTIGTLDDVNSSLNTSSGSARVLPTNNSTTIEGDEMRLEQSTLTNTNNLLSNTPRIYPNPARDFITIENGTFGDIIQIFNTNGQLVKTVRYNSSTTQVPLNELSAGTYYLKMAATIEKLVIIK